MLWNDQRNQLTTLVSQLSEENADIATISHDISSLLNENPDELVTLEKTQAQLNTANTRLEEVRKTNRDLLSRISATSSNTEPEVPEVSIDTILKGVL